MRAFTKDELLEMQRLWEQTPATATQIAKEFDVTKNVIMGVAYRRNWISYVPLNYKPKSTMASRLDAYHQRMDQILHEQEKLAGVEGGARLASTQPASQRSSGHLACRDNVAVTDNVSAPAKLFKVGSLLKTFRGARR